MDLDLDLRSLQIVRAIADTGTITAAAAQLGYSQPAISQHLRRAEARFGLPLVMRAGRGIRLTEAGQVLARHAIAISSAFDAAAGDLAELAGLRTGLVRIASFPTASSTIVPRLLSAMAERHPGIVVSYVEAEPPEALTMLREGTVDLAITFTYPGDRADPHRDTTAGFVVAPLFTEDVLLVLPSRHRLASGHAVRMTDLASEHWVAGCQLCRGHLLAASATAGFTPVIDHETDNAIAVLHLVASNLGVALLPRLALATAAIPPGVTMQTLASADTRNIQLVSPAGAVRVPALTAAMAAIMSVPGDDWGLLRAQR